MRIFKTFILLLFLSIGGKVSAQMGGYKAIEGIQYKIIVDSAGPAIELGGAAFIHMSYSNEKDTFDTKVINIGMPFLIAMPDSITEKVGLERGLRMLSKGDSASFIISTDFLYELPREEMESKGFKEGSVTTFFVRIVDALSKDSVNELRKKMTSIRQNNELQKAALLRDDTLAILSYCKREKFKPKKTPLGVYYIIKKSKKGRDIQFGDSVTVFYTGKFMDGEIFDTNVKGEPFTNVVGNGMVIPGWDSGLMAIKKGDKATFFIPSGLAYGENGTGLIPPNSILIFDIEVLNK